MTSDAPAGSVYRYDGDRYAALTSVVEACTGRPFRVALESEILDRLGMSDSVPGHDLADPPLALASLFVSTTLERYRQALTRLAKPYRSLAGLRARRLPAAWDQRRGRPRLHGA